MRSAASPPPDRLQFAPARSSRGSTPEGPRLQFDVFLPVGSSTPLDLLLFTRAARQVMLSPDVLMAPRTIYADPGALLLDLAAPGGLLRVWALCETAVLVTRTLALATIVTPPDQWEPVLGTVLADDPSSAVLKVRWRPSQHGGRRWAAPPATARQVQARRRAAGTGPTDVQLADVFVSGPLGWDTPSTLRSLMSAVATHVGLALTELPTGAPTAMLGWRLQTDGDAAAPAARVRLYLPDLSSCEAVHSAVHGRAIQV